VKPDQFGAVRVRLDNSDVTVRARWDVAEQAAKRLEAWDTPAAAPPKPRRRMQQQLELFPGAT